MKPVYQTLDPGQFRATGNGDCLRACIASLLELPLAAVPHFMETAERARVWPDALAEWLSGRGLELEIIAPSPDLHETMHYMRRHHPGEHYILLGRTGPDFGHVVVCLDDSIVHDPAPHVPRGVVSLKGPLPSGRYGVLMIRPKAARLKREAAQRDRLLIALQMSRPAQTASL